MTTATLPQQSNRIFLTDGGLETWLIFDEGFDLPQFASFALMDNDNAVAAIKRYYRNHMDVARHHGTGFILESPTWRASQDWADLLAIHKTDLKTLTTSAIKLMLQLRNEAPEDQPVTVISGNIGPRGDGYDPTFHMTAAKARTYHTTQIRTMRDAGAEMITALTMTYTAEAIGITRAATEAGLPVTISFTTGTNGRLPDGTSLKNAIEAVDAATDSGPVYYMINCAHPSHFDHALSPGETWLERIKGLRANASTLSHAELDEAEELDAGDIADLSARYRDLRNSLPGLTVMGGCCGTDHKHVSAIAEACVAA